MQALRSLAFNILFFGWTALLLLATCPFAAFMSGHRMRRLAAFWMRVTHALLRHVVGLDHEIVGRERLPEGPVLFASKHQSSWETMIFHVIRPDTVIGLKDELRRIPIFGWYLLLGGNIRIDRAGAAQALRSLVTGAKEAAAQGCSILIFPEGTRRAPGAAPAYKPGVAALYRALDLPCVPVALNSGLFWGRRSFIKKPGRITLELLEPIPPGLDRRGFMQELELRIETASDRLLAEARDRAAASGSDLHPVADGAPPQP